MQSKRGQVTLFIIIAIVIVAVVVLLLVLIRPWGPREPIKPVEPKSYIAECVNVALEPLVETTASQGGYLEKPPIWIYSPYSESYVGYLCLSTLYYEPCVNQQPALKEYIEEQLKNELDSKGIVSNCTISCADNARKQGWDVSVCDTPLFNVTLTEVKVSIDIVCPMTFTKGDEVMRFERFEPALAWPLYDFVTVANKIVDSIITYGDFDEVSYCLAYPWIHIREEMAVGTKLYMLEEVETGKSFSFAIRNFASSPGL